MNLLSRDALTELELCVGEIEAAAPSLQLLTFRSARERLFAAGADMGEMAAFTPRDADRFARQGAELFARIERLPFATVALIDGDCFGGALDLAMAFDLRIATRRSRISHPGARLGIVTGFGGTSRWEKLLSRSAARTLFLGNSRLDAAEAQSAGVVDRVVETLAEAEPELLRIAALDRSTARTLKEVGRHSPALTSRETLLLARRVGELFSNG